jgi:hypothetical protein
VNNQRSPIKSIAVFLGYVVVGGFIGYGLVNNGDLLLRIHLLGAISMSLLVIAIPLTLFLSVVVHEFGHLLGALSVGFRFRLLTLGPWSIVLTPDGLRHRFNFKILKLIGGQQISTPRNGVGTDKQFLIYLAGGGVTNLVVAALTAVLAWLPVRLPLALKLVLIMFCLMNLVMGLTNLVPFRTKQGIATDGYNMRSIYRRNAEAARFRAQFDLMGYVYAGTRPRDWSRETVAKLQEDALTENEKAYGLLIAYQSASDRGEREVAAEKALQIEALYANIPEAFRAHYAANLAYHFGAYEPDAIKSRRYANDAKRGGYLLSQGAIHLALAATALVEGQYGEAANECDLATVFANKRENELNRIINAEYLADMRQRIAEAQQSSHA